MKRLLSLLAILLLSVPMVSAQSSTQNKPRLHCVPVQQFSQTRTQLECRMTSQEVPLFLVAEMSFPFKVTSLEKSSSMFAATLALDYPAGVVDGDGEEQSTLVFAALNWGNSSQSAQVQAVPLDSLSFLIETNMSFAEMTSQGISRDAEVRLLSPNPSNPSTPLYQEVESTITFGVDGTLFLEAFTRYSNPSVLQFLQLGIDCYQETPQTCLSNLFDRL